VLFHHQQRVQRHSQVTNVVERTDVNTANTQTNIADFIQLQWSNRGRNMAIFEFFKMTAAAILNFSNFKFLTVGRLKRAELRRLAKLGRSRSKRGRDMAIFRFLKMAAADILDFSNFNARNAQDGRTAWVYQIWSKSVKLRPRYGHF